MIEHLVQLKKKKICVIGDFMLDSYTKGSVKRISPEAPVCVLKVKKQEMLPGGAGNVVLNTLALGADVYACGRMGQDFASSYLKNALQEAGAQTSGLIQESGYETPLKNRFMAGYQQLLRVDFENDTPLEDLTVSAILDYLSKILPQMDLVLISDYNKGLLTRDFLKQILSLANSYKVPVFVDPKGHDFSKYKGATLIKPNLTEAYLASGLDEKASLDEVASHLMDVSNCDYLLITRSEKGMSLFDDCSRQDFTAMAKEVVDVTGAGDTVISTLSVAYASGLDLQSCVTLANVAASCAIEKLGCVHVGKKELAKAVSKIDTKFKYSFCQSSDIMAMLLDEEKIIQVELKDKTIDLELLKHLSKIKNEHLDSSLVVVIPDETQEDVIATLSELNPVDFVMTQQMAQSLQTLKLASV
jgi:rfaE bifunctional protein kinase chain/domain